MSKYVISDIHGSSSRFHRMLDLINIDFSEDIIYINGDIVDRGKNSIKLLFEIFNLRMKFGDDHIRILKGNHEHFLERYILGIMPTNYVSTFRPLDERTYSSPVYGGTDTIREVKALSDLDKKLILKFIDELDHYEIIKSPIRGDIVLVHSGLHYEHLIENEDGTINVTKSIESALSANENDFLICKYLQKEAPAGVIRSLDKFMCVGHVPTLFTVGEPVIKMKAGKLIMTDCGSGFKGGRLGCIRIEDEKLFYVD